MTSGPPPLHLPPEQVVIPPEMLLLKSDLSRLNVLYCPFRPKESNPESYSSKMLFWTKSIDEFVNLNNKFTFTLLELQNSFKIENKTPACLQDVINFNSKTMMTRSSFEDLLKSESGWISWSQVYVKNCFLNNLPNLFNKNNDTEEKYIHLPQLKLVSDLIIAKSSPELMSLSKFKAQCGLADPEMSILLDYLKSGNKILIDKVGHEEVIQINSVVKISEVEKGKYDVERTKQILELELEELNQKMNSAQNNAKIALKQGKRNSAKHELKRKKLFEHRINKLLDIVDNLTVISMQIEDAQTDGHILSAYEAGKKALSAVLQDDGLNVHSVTEAMLDIQDLLETQSEISGLISQPIIQEDTFEFDEELELLLKEGNTEQETELDVLSALKELTIHNDDLVDEEVINIKIPSPTSSFTE